MTGTFRVAAAVKAKFTTVPTPESVNPRGQGAGTFNIARDTNRCDCARLSA
jgi:hypothetical protein